MRVIGIIRVSKVDGRTGERFVSPRDQATRIQDWAGKEGFEVTELREELDTSGGLPLTDRPGMLPAIQAIENGEADIIAVAYFDRLVRSITVQHEIVDRVEAAGGRVATMDFGDVSNKTAASWLQGTLVGTFNEFYRRQTREKLGAAQADAIRRGVATWDVQIPGYRKRPDGILEPTEQAPVVQEAFRMRADGATIETIRTHLRDHGIERSYHGVTCLLKSRVVLGELHFGPHQNLTAHEPIINRELWNQVQRTRISRGKPSRSDRLLARLGILLCGTCGSRMVVATTNNSRYWVYRCPPTGDCDRHMSISATIAEQVITDAVWDALEDLEGRAEAIDRGQEVRDRLNKAQADLDAGIRAFAGLEGEAAAVERLNELRAIRDECLAEADHLGRHLVPAETFTRDDWADLTLEHRRALIVATVRHATVGPGKGAGRVTVTLL